MQLTVTEPKAVEVIKAATYKAVLTSLEQEESTNPAPSMFKGKESSPFFLRWVFTVKGKGKSVDLWASSSISFGPKSKAYAWACALLNRKLGPGEQIDTDQLIGCPCLIEVELTEPDDRGFQRNKIVDVTSLPNDEDPF